MRCRSCMRRLLSSRSLPNSCSFSSSLSLKRLTEYTWRKVQSMRSAAPLASVLTALTVRLTGFFSCRLFASYSSLHVALLPGPW